MRFLRRSRRVSALDTFVREELGLDPDELRSPRTDGTNDNNFLSLEQCPLYFEITDQIGAHEIYHAHNGSWLD
jgi:hypothetical protein